MGEASESLRQALAGSRSPTLANVNELALYHSDFHIHSFDGIRLVLVGSFELCYYHGLELHFVEVAHINCPVWFHRPTFSDEGPTNDPASSITEPRRHSIRCDEGRFEIIARTLEIVFGIVHYGASGPQQGTPSQAEPVAAPDPAT